MSLEPQSNLATFKYQTDLGWSCTSFPDLDSDNTLVLLFGAKEFVDSPEAILEVARAFPKSHILGCSTAGEIFDCNVEDNSLSVAVMRFNHTRLETFYAYAKSADDSYDAGKSIAEKLMQSGNADLRGVMIFSDGSNVNGSELIHGLNSILPDAVVVTGGLAGDGDRFEKTWVLKDKSPQFGVVSAVGFYGDRIKLHHGSKGGWDIFGIERRVTHSKANILYELDKKPALELYKKYLGDRAKDLPASALLFPLSVRLNPNDEKQVVRTVLNINEEENSMTFAGDVPEGAMVQLMKANFDRLIDGATEAAIMSLKEDDFTGERLCVAISCVGRRLVLGQRSEEELEATLDVLPKNTKQIGFYAYGEISPYASGHCDLHNQTMTLTVIYEY